jgi:hypothetical protein
LGQYLDPATEPDWVNGRSMNVFCRDRVGEYSERRAVGDAKLPVDPVQVDLDRAFGESEPLRYFLVVKSSAITRTIWRSRTVSGST